MGGRLHRRGAGALYRLSNKSFGFPQGWGGIAIGAKQRGQTIFSNEEFANCPTVCLAEFRLYRNQQSGFKTLSPHA